jgi:hypothetical protein
VRVMTRKATVVAGGGIRHATLMAATIRAGGEGRWRRSRVDTVAVDRRQQVGDAGGVVGAQRTTKLASHD